MTTESDDVCNPPCHAYGIGCGCSEPPLPCRDCGPGYDLGGYGCRHGNYEPELGESGVCRTCCLPIWWEEGEVGHRPRIGWSDRIKRGGDSIVCFSARDYRHVPMGGREAAIYKRAYARGKADSDG